MFYTNKCSPVKQKPELVEFSLPDPSNEGRGVRGTTQHAGA
jgi:hypothetical protein